MSESPAPYSPSGIRPSKLPYSSGWTSVWMASRFCPGSYDGRLGTDHEASAPVRDALPLRLGDLAQQVAVLLAPDDLHRPFDRLPARVRRTLHHRPVPRQHPGQRARLTRRRDDLLDVVVRVCAGPFGIVAKQPAEQEEVPRAQQGFRQPGNLEEKRV